jgi:23S rRNA-/tRNA-specific pseudouridylate synthase
VADDGTLDAPLGRDESCEVTIKDCVRPDGATALTTYRVIQRFTRPEGAFALLEVSPRTGRKHQIRIHLQHLGHPIVGDKLYGGDPSLYLDFVYDRLTPTQRAHLIFPFHALHASRLAISWHGQRWVFRALPEAWFLDFLPETTRTRLEQDAHTPIEVTTEGVPQTRQQVATDGGDFPAGSLSGIRDRQ